MEEQWNFFETIEGDVYLNGYRDFLNETLVPRAAAERTAIFGNMELPLDKNGLVSAIHFVLSTRFQNELPPDSAVCFHRLLAFHYVRMDGIVGFKMTNGFHAVSALFSLLFSSRSRP